MPLVSIYGLANYLESPGSRLSSPPRLILRRPCFLFSALPLTRRYTPLCSAMDTDSAARLAPEEVRIGPSCTS